MANLRGVSSLLDPVASTSVTAPPRCSVAARALGEAVLGTAAVARSWLCIEEPGPWPRDAVERVLRAALPEDARARVEELTVTGGLRVQLVRRTDRRAGDLQQTGPGRMVLLAGTAGGSRWLEQVALPDLRGLADLDLAAVASGGHVPGSYGEQVPEAYLVCTHGTKDRCCALDGRRLATALAARYGDVVWESSHVGGDRFAANLVALPQGLYYGQLDPAAGGEVVDGLRSGRVPVNGLRGRATLPPLAQAAEVLVRQALPEVDADDVEVLAAHPERGSDPYAQPGTVQLRIRGREVELHLQREPIGAAAATVCSGLLRPARWVADPAQLARLVEGTGTG